MTTLTTDAGKNTGVIATLKKCGAGMLVLLMKVGGKLVPALIKMAKALKVGKISLAAGSMGAYALLFSWQFALVIMFALLVHEYGHIWAMKRCGMKVRGMYFIPMLGAAAVSDEAFRTRGEEAYIALMGPIWGGLLALMTFFVYLATGSPMAAAVAGWMALINVFNLLPINPLDGGRIMKSITWSISSKLGLVVAVLMFAGVFAGAYYFRFGLFLFLGIIAVFELMDEFKEIYKSRERNAMLVRIAPLVGLDGNDLEAVRLKVLEHLANDNGVGASASELVYRYEREIKNGATDEEALRTAAFYYDSSRNDSVEGDWAILAEAREIHFIYQESHELIKKFKAIVKEMRQVHKTLFRRKEHYLVGEKSAVYSYHLELFFGEKSKPTMTPFWTAATTLAYFGIFVGLLALMFACREVPAANAALQALID